MSFALVQMLLPFVVASENRVNVFIYEDLLFYYLCDKLEEFNIISEKCR